jgi:hypothetical protein
MVHAPCPVLIVPRSPDVFHATSNNLGVDEMKRFSQ